MSEARANESATDEGPAQQAATLAGLDALALDLRWSWNHAADQLWRRLDPELWDFTHDPRGVLQAVGPERIARECSDPAFRREVADLLEQRETAAASPGWFQRAYPHASLGGVAYFSMEFMLSEALPIYSGGLGNVAGDQLKTASTSRAGRRHRAAVPRVTSAKSSTRGAPAGAVFLTTTRASCRSAVARRDG